MYKGRKVIIIALVILLLSQSIGYALANETRDNNPIQPYYDYLFYMNSFLGSEGDIHCTVDATSSVTHGTIDVTLQRKVLLWWSTVETWEQNFIGNLGTLSRKATLESGNTYRLKATYTVYANGESESFTDYSKEVTK